MSATTTGPAGAIAPQDLEETDTRLIIRRDDYRLVMAGQMLAEQFKDEGYSEEQIEATLWAALEDLLFSTLELASWHDEASGGLLLGGFRKRLPSPSQ
jgi:hypothetical protein